MAVIRLILGVVRAFIIPRTVLAVENLALHQQLIVLQCSRNLR